MRSLLIHPKQAIILKKFSLTYKNDKSTIKKIKTNCKSRSIKDYKNKSKEYLTKLLSEWKPKINPFFKKIKDIKIDFSELRHSLSMGFLNKKIPSL